MNFSPSVFYKIGIVVFLVMGFGNGYSLIMAWDGLDLGIKFARSASVFFNFLLAYFFYWIFNSQQKKVKEEIRMQSDDNILEMAKNISKNK